MSDGFFIDPLSTEHERAGFDSGVEALDTYFRVRVGQDVRRRVSSCFVAVESGSGAVAGYYTLAMSSVLLAELPGAMVKKLPRYPTAPVARLGRLAVDGGYRGKGLGAALLLDAADRVRRSEIAAFGIVVDAKDDTAAAFYRHHGFEPLPSNDLALILPMAALKV